MRIKRDDIDLRAAAEGFDRGAAGIAGSRDHDGGALVSLQQHVIHQPGDQLHRQILEGERRAVKEFEHEQIGVELHERRGRRVAERAIGLARHARKIGLGDGLADKRLEHFDRDFGVRAAGKTCNHVRRKLRPRFRHIKPAVAGQACEHHLDKIERGALAPR